MGAQGISSKELFFTAITNKSVFGTKFVESTTIIAEDLCVFRLIRSLENQHRLFGGKGCKLHGFFLGNIAYQPQYATKKRIFITFGPDNLKSHDCSISVCLFLYSAHCFGDSHLTLTLI